MVVEYNALDYSENRDGCCHPPTVYFHKQASKLVRSIDYSGLIGVKSCLLPEYPPTADYAHLSVRLLTVGPDAKLSDKATSESNIRSSMLSPLTPIALSNAGRGKINRPSLARIVCRMCGGLRRMGTTVAVSLAKMKLGDHLWSWNLSEGPR